MKMAELLPLRVFQFTLKAVFSLKDTYMNDEHYRIKKKRHYTILISE